MKIPNIGSYGFVATSPKEMNDSYSMGPLRVMPGRLSVSRTLGDIEAKYEEFGG